MRIPVSIRLSALVVLLGAAEAPSSQQDYHWSGTLAPGQRLEIKGVNGAIHAQPSSGSEVRVTAVRRAGRRGRVADVRIERVAHAGGVTFCAIYPSRGSRPNRCTAGDEWRSNVHENDVNVDFTVHVPRGVHFLGRTVNGAVRAESLPADARVSTVNGAVTVSAAGVVEASTVNGDIQASTGRADAGRSLDFTTVNGDVVLRVPSGFRAQVRASLLNGSIESDFPLRITRGRYVGESATGQIGGGGHELHMETVNGDLEIRRAGRGR